MCRKCERRSKVTIQVSPIDRAQAFAAECQKNLDAWQIVYDRAVLMTERARKQVRRAKDRVARLKTKAKRQRTQELVASFTEPPPF